VTLQALPAREHYFPLKDLHFKSALNEFVSSTHPGNTTAK
jgi:hypothetical protein